MTPWPPKYHIPVLPASNHHPLSFSPQVSLISLDVEVLLTLGLNFSCLGWAEHILELQPVLESLRGQVHYVIIPSNEQFLLHASPL